MQDQSKQLTKVEVTMQTLNAVQSVREIFDIPDVREACIGMYARLNNANAETAVMRYETEKALLLQQMPKLEKCNRLSIYNSTLELLMSGLTLREGMAYIVPMGSTAAFMPGWKGRLEQLQEMPSIIHVHAPVVVYDCDTFKFSRPGGKLKILDHMEGTRTKESKITKVYMIITFKGVGDIVYMMDALDVYNIRDRRSASWKQHIKALPNIATSGPNAGSLWIQQGAGDGNGFWKVYEPPMWVTDEAQAFKKTLVKRVYNEMPNKLPKHKHIDDYIESNVNGQQAEHDEPEIDPEEMGTGDGYSSYEEIENEMGNASVQPEKPQGPPVDTNAY